ncbi:uncharacterized protein LOC116778680 [Danaus plexippus]|uniref:uncharacterized protein LOC116778680 n=1 Tax=Danaus plexippus TaxID=13037 RepID=UPI002AB10E5B|nr:uncharacterized protein LOC116778680 [Danaus plexippus]XP_061385935.1 uncharacterized protein LOC116778680 [Danaus plexippus]
MWEYLFVLLIGFWLGVAIFLYVSCFWLEEILDLPHRSGRARSPSASGAHAQLKRLVARVVEEAAALPALARYAAEPTTPCDASTYEDLLATAILNKVIERYQTESGSGGRSSGIHSASASPSPSERSSPRSLNSRATREITPPVCEEDASDWEEDATDGAELPKRVPFPEYGGDIVHTNEFRDFDEVSGSDIQAADGSWEENWLFQKKKIKTIQSAPVPMLVPNSNTQYRALIGDRDADDTTDLSDNASDAEEDQYKSGIQKVVDSRRVIGGKPKIEEVLDFEPDSLNMVDDTEIYEEENRDDAKDIPDTPEKIVKNDSKLVVAVDSGPIHRAEFNLTEEIHRTVLNGHNGDSEEDTPDKPIEPSESSTANNTLSRSEREKDYEEAVSLPVQRYADSLRKKHFEEPLDHSTPNGVKEEELLPGSIAYRERKKWLNYVEMPNNPYSPEAIKKRLSAKSTSSLFDTLTKKEQHQDKHTSNEDVSKENVEQQETEGRFNNNKLRTSMSSDNVLENRRSVSPSMRSLRSAVSEDATSCKRYDRDYYIKEARNSSGERRKSGSSGSLCGVGVRPATADRQESPRPESSPGLLIKQFNTMAANRQHATFTGREDNVSITTMPAEYSNEIIIEYEDVHEHSLFDGKVDTDEDTDKKFQEILNMAYNNDHVLLTNKAHELENSTSTQNSLSSSSLGDSIKIYNVQTGEVVKCKPEDKLSSQRYGAEADTVPDNDAAATSAATDISAADEHTAAETLDAHRTSEIDDLPEHLPSVKELAKKFVSMESLSEQTKPVLPMKRHKSKENILSPETTRPATKLTYMHSLTARSISREFREELKLSMATPLTVPGGAKDIPEGEEVTRESSRPGSPVPEPGTIKTKLAFFESLKSKFSK